MSRIISTFAVAVIALSVNACATMAETDELRNRATLLEARMTELQSQTASQAEEANTVAKTAAEKMSAEARAIRESLAGLGARVDSLGNRVMVLEGRTEEVQTSAGKVSAASARLSQMEADQTRLAEVIARLEQRIAEMEGAKKEAAEIDDAGIYKTSLQAHNAGRYAEAREGFARILESRPDSTYAANALFWMGEGFYKEEQYDDALEQYMVVIQKHASSDKVCPSLLKAGITLEQRKEDQKARVFYRQVVERCAESPQVEEARRRLGD